MTCSAAQLLMGLSPMLICGCVLVLETFRPGTPAARMKRVPTNIVKERSRQLSKLVETFTGSCATLLGSRQKVWVSDTAADGHHLVGHTKTYTQVEKGKGVSSCWSTTTIMDTSSSWCAAFVC